MVKHSDSCYKVTNNISHVQHMNVASPFLCLKTDVPHVGWPMCPMSVDRRGARRFRGCERGGG